MSVSGSEFFGAARRGMVAANGKPPPGKVNRGASAGRPGCEEHAGTFPPKLPPWLNPKNPPPRSRPRP